MDVPFDLPHSAGPHPPGPLGAYRALLTAGSLKTDPSQALAVERLQDLWVKLRGYNPPPRPETTNFLGRLLRLRPAEWAPDEHPNGLYLVGDVGRGKSMLMDLFFIEARVARKRRVHFHRFMQDVHARIFAWRQAHPGDDPIPPLADALASGAALLCLDEFQVNDIADAMILGRLFQALFERAVVVVTTSNIVPDDLFRGKPGRDAFLPFVALLKHHLDVLAMDGGRDYRRQRLHGLPTWHVPSGARADAALDEAFTALSGGGAARPARLLVSGRTLQIPLAADRVARFDFEALCGQPLGAGDYLAIAIHYEALVLDGVPRLGPNNYDRARRFITLVDALYDHRVKLVASADAAPDQLYERGEGARAFERTASRLEEMQGQDWLGLPHLT